MLSDIQCNTKLSELTLKGMYGSQKGELTLKILRVKGLRQKQPYSGYSKGKTSQIDHSL